MNECHSCGTDWTDYSLPLYTVCSECHQLVKLADDWSDGLSIEQGKDSQTTATMSSETKPPSAGQIHVTIQHGNLRLIETVDDVLNKHHRRLQEIESRHKDWRERVCQLERLVKITLSRQCPECNDELVLKKSGALRCSGCEMVFPTNPRLESE